LSIDNLDDYILRFKMYQEGDYEYGTLISPAHVKNAIESGKKIVFVKSQSAIEKVIIGSVLLILGLIIGIVISFVKPEFWIIAFSIPMVIFGGFRSLLPNSWASKKRYILCRVRSRRHCI
jgi:hypothetical protein